MLHYALMASVVLGSTFLATTAHASYESYDSDSKAVSQMSYKYAKKHLKHVYKLAFFENEASDDDDTTYYKLGWYTAKHKLKQHTLSSDDDSWQEIVDPNLKTPYVVISNDVVAGVVTITLLFTVHLTTCTINLWFLAKLLPKKVTNNETTFW